MKYFFVFSCIFWVFFGIFRYFFVFEFGNFYSIFNGLAYTESEKNNFLASARSFVRTSFTKIAVRRKALRGADET